MSERAKAERQTGMHPLLAGALLITLAVLSFAASFVSLRGWALPIALAVAMMKAAVVLIVFMGLGRQTASIKLAALAAILMLLLLTGFVVADSITREANPVVELPAPSARDMRVIAHGHEQ